MSAISTKWFSHYGHQKLWNWSAHFWYLYKKNLLLPYILYHNDVFVRILLCPSTAANINQSRYQQQRQVCRHSTLAGLARQSSAPLHGRNYNFHFIQTSLQIPKVPL
jgi:hypothetical protein